jgi:protein arginine kinase activator
MMCQRCHNEATVHLAEPKEGGQRELHLCRACAKKAGVTLAEKPPNLALDAVINDLIVANVGELVGELAQTTCVDCGVKFMEFRAAGRLGCPQDYCVFAKGLMPLLLRYHGATRHVGKVARRRQGASDRLRLRTRLREAIAREQYEEAARLRDRLRTEDPHA